MATSTLIDAPTQDTARRLGGISLATLRLVPDAPSLERVHEVLADAELESFGALKPTDSSCYGAQLPCNQTCC